MTIDFTLCAALLWWRFSLTVFYLICIFRTNVAIFVLFKKVLFVKFFYLSFFEFARCFLSLFFFVVRKKISIFAKWNTIGVLCTFFKGCSTYVFE